VAAAGAIWSLLASRRVFGIGGLHVLVTREFRDEILGHGASPLEVHGKPSI
jgi:hypothetical protein